MVLLAGTFVLWALEAAVYLAVAHSVDLGISMTGALYLVALTNFVAALPAAPGSIGTFDAAVAFGASRLGASGSAAVSYLLMLRFVLYVPITLVGLRGARHALRRLVALRAAAPHRSSDAPPRRGRLASRTRPPPRRLSGRADRPAAPSAPRPRRPR